MTMMVHITPPPLSSQSMADLLCTMVLLCRGNDMYGRRFWAYMCIKPSMAEAFRKAREAGNFNLGEYGTIIEAGEGETVPQDVQQRMARDYGVRPDYEQELLSIFRNIHCHQPA
ncbi:MAG: hypothetical protein EBV03_04810 [Proteobacteria bacterium]|nr:hypothetical protein [Pseudomonadota bacterium]